MENLSLIPGNVGAAPMQNIGAYGVEQQDLFHSLEAVNLETGNIEIFEKPDCNFGYRESVFKNKLKDKYLILNVTYRLKKTIETNVEYGAIKAELAKTGKAENPHPRDISDAVRKIRNSKLPNPDQLGNAGSFFKNPVIAGPDYDELKKKFPDMVGFPQEGGRVKIAAGWLIDHLGWKGKRIGDAGVHEKQALVLVNHGNASGKDVLDLAKQIQESVHETFGISLLPEVNII
jgi:UDP-N-acetylmuramate dehydrogenase